MNAQPKLTRIATVLLYALPALVFIGKAYVDTAASLIAIFFLLHSVLQKDASWLKSGWIRIALAFWAYLILRSFFAPDIPLALSIALPFGRFILFAAAIAFWLGRQERFSQYMLRAMALGVGLLAADTWLQFMHGTDILGKPKWAGERLTGPFRRPRVGYTTTWMLFPLLAVLVAPKKPLKNYLLSLLCAALLMLAVLITGERTPLLLLLMGLGITCILYSPLRKWALLFTPLFVLAAGAFLWLNPQVYERQVVSTQATIANLWETPYGRIWLDARDTILRAPVAGIGPHHYRAACKEGDLHYRECQLHPHNFYLEITSETGVIGLFGLLCMFGSWVYSMWKNRGLAAQTALVTGLFAGLLMRLWPIIANPSFYESWNVIPLWLLVGWMYSILPRHEPSPLHPPA